MNKWIIKRYEKCIFEETFTKTNKLTTNKKVIPIHATYSRRQLIYIPSLTLINLPVYAESLTTTQLPKFTSVNLKPELTPDQSKYDPKDDRLRIAAQRLQDALNAPSLNEEEKIWTEIINEYENDKGIWVPDLIGRAYSNRGNAKSRRGDFQGAIDDYDQAMVLCPWSVDPILNRGVVFERLGLFDLAIHDYREILNVAPYDPACWNNLGNAYAGKGDWKMASEYYKKASLLAPKFSFAFANRALALFEIGEEEESMKLVRSLLRKYPDFPDMRAALAAMLWNEGREGDAESEWIRVDDPRYKDNNWLKIERRWPPRLIEAINAFLELKSL